MNEHDVMYVRYQAMTVGCSSSQASPHPPTMSVTHKHTHAICGEVEIAVTVAPIAFASCNPILARPPQPTMATDIPTLTSWYLRGSYMVMLCVCVHLCVEMHAY